MVERVLNELKLRLIRIRKPWLVILSFRSDIHPQMESFFCLLRRKTLVKSQVFQVMVQNVAGGGGGGVYMKAAGSRTRALSAPIRNNKYSHHGRAGNADSGGSLFFVLSSTRRCGMPGTDCFLQTRRNSGAATPNSCCEPLIGRNNKI